MPARVSCLLTLVILYLVPRFAVAQVPVLEEDRKIVPTDGEPFDRFGRSVAVSGGQGLVGAPFDDDAAESAGAVYLYDLDTGGLVSKILPNEWFSDGDTFAEDSFGDGLAFANGFAGIGAWTKDAAGTLAGAAYTLDVTSGQPVEFLLPESPPPFSPIGSAFGEHLALSSDARWMVIGARGDTGHGDVGANGGGGAAYIFDNELGLERKVFASDAGFADNFGTGVGISEVAAVVGAAFDNDNGSDSGSAYVIDPVTGIELAKLVPSDTAAGDFFGWTVAVSGSIAAVGAPYHDGQQTDSGAVYLYELTTGQQLHKIELEEAVAGELFGFGLAMDAGVLVVGGGGERAFVVDTASGELLAELRPSDPAFEQFFGISVAVNGSLVMIGAEGDEANGERSGAAYVYEIRDLLPGGTVHVASIEPGVFRSGDQEGAEVVVTLVDSLDAPVADAEVAIGIRAVNGASANLVGSSGPDGVAVLRTRRTAAPPLAYRVCVLDVVASLPYEPAANVETCDARF